MDRIGELMALVDRYATPLPTRTTDEEEAADAYFDGLRGRIESAARALAGEAAIPQEPVASAQWRAAMIEECARHLEAAAKDFIRLGNEAPEGQRDGPYGMADTYGMAANEVRRMDPEHVAKEARNHAEVKKWVKRIGSAEGAGWPPELEPSRKLDN